ncbi:uncharacterized protein LOC101846637 [Aplysia californica]|uniref:Uncharacterized protein LOC101846637 n=1 Tax=Aplysia californica TaxID=6500 RepID=A0ABM0JJ64_APLCA|nr:uncharacterized protein LOC101846637 [Aplysia californica]
MSHTAVKPLRPLGNSAHSSALHNGETTQSSQSQKYNNVSQSAIPTPVIKTQTVPSKNRQTTATVPRASPLQLQGLAEKPKKSPRWSDEATSPSPAGIENRDPELLSPRKDKYVPAATPLAPPVSPVSSYLYDQKSVGHRDANSSRSPLSHLELEDDEVYGRTPNRPRSGSVPSRSSSRQSRYHGDCTPREDPDLIIGSRSRRDRLLGKAREKEEANRRRRRPSSLVSGTSLLSRRESILNIVYTGGREEQKEDKSRFGYFRSQSVLSRMTPLLLQGEDVLPGEYMVVEEDDYSTSKGSRSHSTSSLYPRGGDRGMYRPGFLYQQLGFRELSESVPSFVRQHTDKTGRLMTESFILKVNYLRRRRQLGEMSGAASSNSSSKRSQLVSSPHDKTTAGGRGGAGDSDANSSRRGADVSSSEPTPRP